MTPYTYLLQIDKTLKLVRSEKEKPFQPDENGIMAFFGTKKELEIAEKEWLDNADKFDIADKENEQKFMQLACKFVHPIMDGITESTWTAVEKGILIPSENVEIGKQGICCMTSKEYPFHGPHCDFCDDYKERIVARFVSPPLTKIEESQDEPTVKELTAWIRETQGSPSAMAHFVRYVQPFLKTRKPK